MILLRLKKLLSAMRNRRSIFALTLGVVASVEHKRILKSQPWRCIIDVGANKGQFALEACSLIPNAKVHSFEPLRSPASVFKKIFQTSTNAILHEFAIGELVETRDMFVSARDDSSSLLPIGKLQVETFPGTDGVGTERVEVRHLDQIISAADLVSPCLLKIDVQGFELEVLKGCKSLLGRVDYIYVECSLIELYEGQSLFGEVVVWLKQQEFVLCDIGPMYRDHGRAIQADFLFKKDADGLVA